MQSKLQAARVKLQQARLMEPASASSASARECAAAISTSSPAHASAMLGMAYSPRLPGTCRDVPKPGRAHLQQSHSTKGSILLAAERDASAPAGQSSARSLADHELCVVCMEAGHEVSFQPCGHAVTCKPCANKVNKKTGVSLVSMSSVWACAASAASSSGRLLSLQA